MGPRENKRFPLRTRRWVTAWTRRFLSRSLTTGHRKSREDRRDSLSMATAKPTQLSVGNEGETDKNNNADDCDSSLGLATRQHA
jgi:hypothetical protein